MTGYLRRVAERSSGRPASSVRAVRPRRWSNTAAEPFGVADVAAAGASPPLGRTATEATALSGPAVPSSPGSAGLAQPSATPTFGPDGSPTAASPVPLPAEGRPDAAPPLPMRVTPGHPRRHGQQEPADPSGVLEPSPRALARRQRQPPTVASLGRRDVEGRRGAARDPAAREERAGSASPAGQDLTPPMALRRAPLADRATVDQQIRPPADQSARWTPTSPRVDAGPVRRAAVAGGAGRQPAGAAMAPRAPVVIGRITVVVDRPAEPAPRPTRPRRPPSATPAVGPDLLAHRFGIGQL